MPIISTDLKFRLSGGASNSNPLLSLGGSMSSVDVGAGILDDVTGTESVAGRVEYRCIYVVNTHGTLVAQAARAWVPTNTPSPDSTLDIALGSSAAGSAETAVGSETTAPAGLTWLPAASESGAVAMGDIPAGSYRAIWIRRTVNAGAAAAADSFTLRVKCDTAA